MSDDLLSLKVLVGRYVRQRCKEVLETTGEVRYPLIADEAKAQFLADPEVQGRFSDLLRQFAYAAAVDFGVQQRGKVIPAGDRLMTPKQFTEHLAAKASKWTLWLEQSGGRSILLLEMRKFDLLQAAQLRRERARTDLERATFLERLAARLDDTQCVQDVFSDAELSAMYAQLRLPEQRKPARRTG